MKKYVLPAAVLLAVIVVILGVRKFPDVKADVLEQMRRAEIYDLSGVDKARTFHAKIDTLMAFVHNNSVHNIDDEFWDDFRNKPRTLDKLLAHAKGESKERPHMECSTRSKLLLPLIRKAGFEAHMVDLFMYKPQYDSHVVVEVKNPDTGLWEVYDPTYKIHWKNQNTNARASMRDLVFTPNFPFTPCLDEIRCGYGRTDHAFPVPEKVEGFFGLAVLMDDEGQGSVQLNNPERFDLNQKPEGGDKVFCDWAKKRWCPETRENPPQN